MPKKALAKSSKKIIAESTERSLLTIVIALFVIFFAIYLVLRNDTVDFIDPKGGKIEVRVSDNEAERIKGLSGSEPLANNSGMLFIFDQDIAQNCFWMKDMKFDIDIIWLDEQKRVVDVKQGARKDSYPEVYCPRTTSRYVLEVPSGQAAARGFIIGAQAKF